MPSCITKSKIPLLDYQIKVVEFLENHRGLILSHSLGTGKTLTAITASQCYLDKNLRNKVFVVTPTSLQINFTNEMKTYGVTNFDRYRFFTFQKFATTFAHENCESHTMLIIDEAHNLRTEIKKTSKTTTGIRAEALIRCSKKADKVLLLTATSIYNEPFDIANLIAMIRGENPVSYKDFYQRIMLHERDFAKYFSMSISFFDPGKDENYPTYDEYYIVIPMTKEYYKEYKQVEHQISPIFQNKDPFAYLSIVRQATNSITKCLKCDWTFDKVKTGEKTLIYSSFLNHGVKVMEKMLTEHDIGFVEITGSMNSKHRYEAMEKFNNNEVNILFITKAGGEGLDLKGVRNVIIFESPWNQQNLEQIIGRAVRYKSHEHLPKEERHVDVYHLVVVKPYNSHDNRASADEMLQEIIEKKEIKNRRFMNRLKQHSIES